MSVKQHNGRWVVEFQQRGIRVHRRCPAVATKEQARALETKLRREIFNQKDLGQAPSVPLGAAIELWLGSTLPHRKDQRVKYVANQWIPFLSERTMLQDASKVAQSGIASWNSSAGPTSRSQPLSAATINRRLCVLKATLKHAYKQGWIAENLSARITLLREENMREVYLTPQEITRLAGCATSPTCTAAIMIAAYTGLRASELLALTAGGTQRGMLTVGQSKNGKPRQVPIVPLLRPYLAALPLGISYNTLSEHFRKARKAAGMEHVNFHDLRHTCASMLINNGVDLYTVGRILGNPSAVQRYAHLSNATLTKAMRKIGK